MATLQIDLPAELHERLEAIAAHSSRSAAVLVEEAISDFVKRQESWDRIEQALDEVRNGRFIDNERVDAWLASWGTDGELPPPTWE